MDLTQDSLLLKCLHGNTQNNNESLNGVAWKRCRKDIYVGREVLEIGIASAVICYNDGLRGITGVLKALNIDVGRNKETFFEHFDGVRIKKMNIKSSGSAKLRRNKLRAIRKGWHDNALETEGETYASGEFT